MAAYAFAQTAVEEEATDLVTFYLGDLLLGADIRHVDEINRDLEVTPVPHAPGCVRGVANLRGDVVTILDLREILGFPQMETTRQTRNVIMQHQGERVGMLVDRIADVVRVEPGQFEPYPSNLPAVDRSFFQGVYKLEGRLLVVLNLEQVLNSGIEG